MTTDPYLTDALPGGSCLFSGCVIRFSNPDGSPTIHANASHLAAGVTSVEINPANGALRVQQTITDPTRYPILFAVAQPDETLVQRGISFGVSGGTDTTQYIVYDSTIGRALDLREPEDLLRLQGDNANCWLGWVHADTQTSR